IWSDSAPEVLNAAESYEVYGKKKDDREYSFVGNTKDARFLVRSLQPNTTYNFMVRALNKYGGAEEFAEVTVRTFTEREDDKLKDKLEELDKEEKKLRDEGKEEVIGDSVIKTIGSEQIPKATYFDNAPYVIDFSTANYKDYNKFVVALPIDLVSSSDARRITITDGTLSFTLQPRHLYTREVSQIDPEDIDDAYVRVSFERITGKAEESLRSAIPRTQTRASRTYAIDFQLQAGTNMTDIRRMMQQGELQLKHDSIIYSGAKQNSLFIGKYDASQDSFIKLKDGSTAAIQETGRYTLLSNR
ncbi:MAG: fibronectin type III domain-containing protein, partial [Clostridiaceae bacterium]|nr:fibronectin type III domain-containing protein [Clostridiaceae bacterium]